MTTKLLDAARAWRNVLVETNAHTELHRASQSTFVCLDCSALALKRIEAESELFSAIQAIDDRERRETAETAETAETERNRVRSGPWRDRFLVDLYRALNAGDSATICIARGMDHSTSVFIGPNGKLMEFDEWARRAIETKGKSLMGIEGVRQKRAAKILAALKAAQQEAA